MKTMGLLALAAVPLVFGAFRLVELATGAPVTPENARFFAAPTPVVLHIVSVTLFALLGPLQLSSGLRRRFPRVHRGTGWVLAPAGLVVATTGLWMQATYALPPQDGAVLAVIRYFFGSAMVVSLVLGVAAVFRRDFAAHGAWMLRAYAIGMGAGTQVLTHLPWALALGQPSVGARAFLMAAAWVINLAVAEWFIRRQSAVPLRVVAL